jgi:glutamate racemase
MDVVDYDPPIGVFDSGVGGLTVCRSIMSRLPSESILYLGDTARVPYGSKSAQTIVQYARNCSQLLSERGIKLLVVACNTASAYAVDVLRDELDAPVLGVVQPGARAAVEATRNGRIGVIGTAGAIASRAYQTAIEDLDPKAQPFMRPCPLFVPLAEEGWTEGDVPERIAETYLRELLDQSVDTLLLGCTHYPLLKAAIQRVAGEDVQLVDSAEATALVVEETLKAAGLAAPVDQRGASRFLVTDSPHTFAAVGERFLGAPIGDVEWVDISQSLPLRS